MSTGTHALKRSMPNQWAQSSQLSMSIQTQALKRPMASQWARSYQCQDGHKPSYKCQDGHKLLIDQ